jgi:branched-chain amino acid transport system substrate-binding protein
VPPRALPRSRAGPSPVALACALALTIAGAGCGATAGDDPEGPLTVYVSVPLRGEHAAEGRAIRDGVRLALADAEGKGGEVEVEVRFLDATGEGPGGPRWDPAIAATNARTATQDTSAIAYIGDFESGATRGSLPVSNQAAMLQVSPASTALDLTRTGPEGGDEVPELVQPSGERTFVRVIADDTAQAEAAAGWAKRLGARRAAVLTDGSEFGELIAAEFVEEAGALGVEIVAEERASAAAARRLSRAGPDLVYWAGEGEGALPTLRAVADAAPGATILGPDALLLEPGFVAGAGELEPRLRITSAAQDPAQLPPEGRRFAAAYRERYGRDPNRYAAYGYEAVALVLDAIDRAGAGGEDRRDVIDAALETRARGSVLGTYSIDSAGDTTLDAIAAYRIEGGEPVFERSLSAP